MRVDWERWQDVQESRQKPRARRPTALLPPSLIQPCLSGPQERPRLVFAVPVEATYECAIRLLRYQGVREAVIQWQSQVFTAGLKL
jgi:hypothetical protein